MITVFLGILAISNVIEVGWFSIWNNKRSTDTQIKQYNIWKEVNEKSDEQNKRIIKLRNEANKTIKTLAFTINNLSQDNAEHDVSIESLLNRVTACENKLFPKKEIKKEKGE